MHSFLSIVSPRPSFFRVGDLRRRFLRIFARSLIAMPVGVGVALAGAPSAEAAAGDCVPSNVAHTNKDGGKSYMVNEGNNLYFPGTSSLARRGAVIASADTWNETGNAGHFKYIGSTMAVDIPDNLTACSNMGVDYSLIVFVNESGDRATTYGRCYSNGKATQFLTKVRAYDGLGNPWHWSTGAITAGEFDLIQTLTHELGHTQGLGHPANGEAAVMQPTAASVGRTRQRDLYQWDYKCGAALSGRRKLSGYRYNQSGGSFVASDVLYTDLLKASKGTVSFSKSVDGIWSYYTVMNQEACVFSTQGLYSKGNCVDSADPGAGIGPRAVTWREEGGMDRAFYSDWKDGDVPYAWSSVHRVRYSRSADWFVNELTGAMNRCLLMKGWFTCGTTTPLSSSKMISTAWDPAVGRSITSWVSQNRTDDVNDGRVFVSIGLISNTTLPQPDALPIKSLVSPGLACLPGVVSGYDCILAYVDPADDEHNVRLVRFSPAVGMSRYSVVISSSPISLGVASSSSIAAWATPGKLWLAVRPATSGQDMEVYSSSNGLSWTQEAGAWGYSVVGPSAVGDTTMSTTVLITWK